MAAQQPRVLHEVLAADEHAAFAAGDDLVGVEAEDGQVADGSGAVPVDLTYRKGPGAPAP